MIATTFLCYWVVSREAAAAGYGYFSKHDNLGSLATPSSATGAGVWTPIFAWYCLVIHILVSMFPLRACWSIWDVSRSLKKAAHARSLRDIKVKPVHRRRDSSTSLSSSETLTSSRDGSFFSSTPSSEAGDFETGLYAEGDTSPDAIVHAIVIPNYKEEVDMLRETLEVLAYHPQARDSYDVSPIVPHYTISTRLSKH